MTFVAHDGTNETWEFHSEAHTRENLTLAGDEVVADLFWKSRYEGALEQDRRRRMNPGMFFSHSRFTTISNI